MSLYDAEVGKCVEYAVFVNRSGDMVGCGFYFVAGIGNKMKILRSTKTSIKSKTDHRIQSTQKSPVEQGY